MYNYGAQSMEYPGSSYNISGGKGASLGTYRNQYYTPGPSSFLDRNKYQMQERSRSNLGNNSSIQMGALEQLGGYDNRYEEREEEPASLPSQSAQFPAGSKGRAYHSSSKGINLDVAIEGEDLGRKKEKDYYEDLKRQVELKRATEEKTKRARLQKEKMDLAQLEANYPFGREGSGAPMRDSQGRIITTRKPYQNTQRRNIHQTPIVLDDRLSTRAYEIDRLANNFSDGNYSHAQYANYPANPPNYPTNPPNYPTNPPDSADLIRYEEEDYGDIPDPTMYVTRVIDTKQEVQKRKNMKDLERELKLQMEGKRKLKEDERKRQLEEDIEFEDKLERERKMLHMRYLKEREIEGEGKEGTNEEGFERGGAVPRRIHRSDPNESFNSAAGRSILNTRKEDKNIPMQPTANTNITTTNITQGNNTQTHTHTHTNPRIPKATKEWGVSASEHDLYKSSHYEPMQRHPQHSILTQTMHNRNALELELTQIKTDLNLQERYFQDQMLRLKEEARSAVEEKYQTERELRRIRDGLKGREMDSGLSHHNSQKWLSKIMQETPRYKRETGKARCSKCGNHGSESESIRGVQENIPISLSQRNMGSHSHSQLESESESDWMHGAGGGGGGYSNIYRSKYDPGIHNKLSQTGKFSLQSDSSLMPMTMTHRPHPAPSHTFSTISHNTTRNTQSEYKMPDPPSYAYCSICNKGGKGKGEFGMVCLDHFINKFLEEDTVPQPTYQVYKTEQTIHHSDQSIPTSISNTNQEKKKSEKKVVIQEEKNVIVEEGGGGGGGGKLTEGEEGEETAYPDETDTATRREEESSIHRGGKTDTTGDEDTSYASKKVTKRRVVTTREVEEDEEEDEEESAAGGGTERKTEHRSTTEHRNTTEEVTEEETSSPQESRAHSKVVKRTIVTTTRTEQDDDDDDDDDDETETAGERRQGHKSYKETTEEEETESPDNEEGTRRVVKRTVVTTTKQVEGDDDDDDDDDNEEEEESEEVTETVTETVTYSS